MQGLQQKIKAAQAGDNKAFSEIYKEFAPMVFCVAKSRLVDSEDARDVMQIVFIDARAQLHRYDHQYRFSTWLHRLTTNACVDFYRKYYQKNKFSNKRFIPLENAYNVEDSALLPSQNYIFQRILKQVNQLLKTYPDKWQVVFNLRIWCGYTYLKISEVTGIAKGTVAFMITSIVKQLHKKLGNDYQRFFTGELL